MRIKLAMVFVDDRDKGVRFTLEPTAMPYGGIDAMFDDGCGNLVNLHQQTGQ